MADLAAARGSTVIVLADTNGWSQPYTHNLACCLSERFTVTVLGLQAHAGPNLFATAAVTFADEPKRGVSRLKRGMSSRFGGWRLATRRRLLAWALPQTRAATNMLSFPRRIAILSHAIRQLPPCHLIAVDAAAILACQSAGRKAHLVSLELLHNDLNYMMLHPESILSVITQNAYRFDHLFPLRDFPCYVVPNFPIYRPRALTQEREGLVLAGTLIPGFGLCAALDFIKQYPDQKLTLLGSLPEPSRRLMTQRYGDLIESERAQLPTTRLPDDLFIDAVGRHRIGLALYELGRTHEFLGCGTGILPESHANYWTGFPGKVGIYASAGVPVIGSDLPGLRFIREKAIGVLVSEGTPDSIAAAVRTIEADYRAFSTNCVQLAQEYCFRKNVSPFLDHLGLAQCS